MEDIEKLQAEVYVVRSSEGKFFRRKGYGGGGNTWVDNLKTARLYFNLSGARAIVSFFVRHYPTYPMPDIIALQVTGAKVLDEAGRRGQILEKAKAKKEKAELASKKQRLKDAQKEFEVAERNLAEALSKP